MTAPSRGWGVSLGLLLALVLVFMLAGYGIPL